MDESPTRPGPGRETAERAFAAHTRRVAIRNEEARRAADQRYGRIRAEIIRLRTRS